MSNHTVKTKAKREQMNIDRSDAVNLARNIRETDNIENVTRKGWLSLVDAVLRMDKYIRTSQNVAPQVPETARTVEARPMTSSPADAAPSETRPVQRYFVQHVGCNAGDLIADQEGDLVHYQDYQNLLGVAAMLRAAIAKAKSNK